MKQCQNLNIMRKNTVSYLIKHNICKSKSQSKEGNILKLLEDLHLAREDKQDLMEDSLEDNQEDNQEHLTLVEMIAIIASLVKEDKIEIDSSHPKQWVLFHKKKIYMNQKKQEK